MPYSNSSQIADLKRRLAIALQGINRRNILEKLVQDAEAYAEAETGKNESRAQRRQRPIDESWRIGN